MLAHVAIRWLDVIPYDTLDGTTDSAVVPNKIRFTAAVTAAPVATNMTDSALRSPCRPNAFPVLPIERLAFQETSICG